MNPLWLAASAVVISYCITWIVRRYALTRQLLDIPNERSSHTVATARGGGLAIVATFIVVLAAMYIMNELQPSLIMAVCGGGALVAAVGFIDDHHHVGVLWRLLVHFIAATWAVFLLYDVPGSHTQLLHPVPPWLIHAFAAVCLVWLTNLYNFMDGIDGIAAVEAITVAGSAAVLLAMYGSPELAAIAATIAAVTAGFLPWNWPPASIFMGDVGSVFLGFLFGTLALASDAANVLPAQVWFILLGAFVVDATWTLVRRLLRRVRVYEAHRSHAYQKASRIFESHALVTSAVALTNILWLLPLALLAASQPEWAWVVLVVAWAPLCILAWWFGAGTDDSSGVPDS